MLQTGLGINQNNDWKFAIPYIYHTGAWQPYVLFKYNGTDWEKICGAGTLMVYFITNDDKYFLTSDSKYFLVRQG